jgi:GxxExxY protein
MVCAGALPSNAEQPLTRSIISCAIEVHRALGPGLLESAYQACLRRELQLHNLRFRNEVELPVIYKDLKLDCGYRADFIVEEKIVVELKAIERILPVHQAQLLTYLRLSGMRLGLLINFNVPVLKDGIRRLVL